MASRVAGATVRAVARKKTLIPSKAALTLVIIDRLVQTVLNYVCFSFLLDFVYLCNGGRSGWGIVNCYFFSFEILFYRRAGMFKILKESKDKTLSCCSDINHFNADLTIATTIATNGEVLSMTLAIRTTVVPIRILIRTTVVPIRILIRTRVVPIRILIGTTGICNPLTC